MTLSSATTKVQYDGDGSTKTFTVTFKFFKNSHVRTVLTDSNGVETVWSEGTDYTLTGAGKATGGTLTATTAPASGETLTIKRNTLEIQESQIPLGGEFPSTTVEDALDLLTMLVQAHTEELDRTLLRVESAASLASIPKWHAGTGSPEGNVKGDVGDIYLRTDGSAGETFYVKESGTGKTGWDAK